MPLTPEQESALDVLEWLFSNEDPTQPNPDQVGGVRGGRRSGRSTALAIAAIRYACRHPRENVYVFDHVSARRMTDHMLGLVKSFVQSDYRLRPHCICSARTSDTPWFRLNLPEPIQDWIPRQFGDESQLFGAAIPLAKGAKLEIPKYRPSSWELIAKDDQ